jgi:hypothetical protein
MSTSTKIESASRRLATVQRHPVSLFFALTYAVSWSLWTPLVIFGDHMPGTLGFVLTVSDSLVPSTVGILICRPTMWQAGRADAARACPARCWP